MKNSIVLQRPAAYLVYGIVVTIPLIFGAVHPIVLGSYVYIMLACLGAWLLLNYRADRFPAPSFSVIVPVILITYLILQSIPIPLDLLELLSPRRAARVRMVNELAGTGLQHISLSENGPVGLYRSFILLAAMLYYFSVKRLISGSRNFLPTLLYCLVGVGTFEAFYGLIQFINPQIGILWLANPERAAHGTIIYKNQYASMLNMIWPLAFASGILYSARSSGKNRRRSLIRRFKETLDEFSTAKLQFPLMIFAAGAMILAVLFSLSRGGILAMVMVGLTLLAVMPFAKTRKIACMAVFVGLIAAYGTLLGLDTIVARFDSLDNSGAHRLDIYLSSLSMLKDHWLTGIGIGSYSLLSPLYLKGFPENILYDKVHNEYLELMIELGVPAATLLFGWILAGMLKLAAGLVSRPEQPDLERSRRVVGGAAFCGLVGFLIHGLADFGWRLPVNLIYCMTLLAICVCSVQPQPLRDVSLNYDIGASKP